MVEHRPSKSMGAGSSPALRSTFMAANAQADDMSTSTKRKRTPRTCLVCGKSFMARTSDVLKGWGNFCSQNCQRGFQARENANNSKKDISFAQRKRNWVGRVGPQVTRAHRIVYESIRKGELMRGPCVICGNEKADAHHEDYSKPLDVRWLCRYHHLQHHRGFN